MNKNKLIFLLILVFLSSMLLINNFLYLPEEKINKVKVQDTNNKKDIYVGVVSRFAPPLIYRGYQPIMDYLTENTNFHFHLKLAKSYDETIQNLAEGKVEIAFVGTYIFLELYDKYNLIPIICPKNNQGLPLSNAVLISNKEYKNLDLNNLKNIAIALPSKKSYSSNWFLKNINNMDNKKIKTEFFSYHTTVIFKVLKGDFDYGVVKENIAKEFANRGLFIVKKSPSIPSSPIVVRENIDKNLLSEFKKALLVLENKHPEVLRDFDKEFQYGFSEVSLNDFLKMKNFVLGDYSNEQN